ncbi:MAG: ABC transporter substrate-binding protein, partial [Chloroflexi bacterium]|nr:ABC transporter substrate-binding protein [Chloroflexota bacterium]
MVKPSGTINVGQKELGPYFGSPKLSGNPQIFLNNAAPVTETLGMYDFDSNKVVPMLAESWDISADGTTWTYHIRKGVQFHKGFGEMTVADVVFSFEQIRDSEKHARASNARKIFFADDGNQTTPDDYTWVVNSGVAFSDIPILELLATPRATMAWIVSKKQFEQDGQEEANRNTAATGPWEIKEWRTGEFWRMAAVENHWRQTPTFAELVEWEIPEESARVAGFKTGNLDTFVMALDSISEIETVEGAMLLQVPNAGQAGLNIYGQTYLPARDGGGKSWPNYNTDLPWVSPNSDVNSAEWETARKVREALSISIDRQTIVDELLLGFGHPLALRDWGGPDEARLPARMVWDFDPEKAKRLLADAGYPNGFKLTLSPALRGAPSEVEACEAIAQYWDDIGLDVTFQNIPYGTLRPTFVARTYEGISCHSVAIRLAPVQGYANYLNDSVFSYGTEHPFLEEKIPIIQTTTDRVAREALELEVADFMFDNIFGETGLYVFDNIWPVGPKLGTWEGFIKQGDLRQINGYEYM